MATLWAAATIKIIGAGLDDDRFLDKVSKLIGDHDVALCSINRSANSQGEKHLGLPRGEVTSRHLRAVAVPL